MQANFLTSDAWLPISETRLCGLTSSTSGTLLLYNSGSVALGAANSAFADIYLDQSDSPISGQGKIKLRATCEVNAVAPAANITISIVPVTSFTGASNVQPTIAAVGAAVAAVTFTTPAASSQTRTDSSAVAVPASGWFAISVVLSQALAANTQVLVKAQMLRQFS